MLKVMLMAGVLFLTACASLPASTVPAGTSNTSDDALMGELGEVCELHQGKLVVMQTSESQTHPFCVVGDKRIDAIQLKNHLATIMIQGDTIKK